MKKKGFTLIELLAIIVILAIIALIAVPVVLNIIDKARISSNQRSSENILEAARLYYNETLLDKDLKESLKTMTDETIYNNVIATISGGKPSNGKIDIQEDGDIALALTYGEYCYHKGYKDVKIEYDKMTETDMAEGGIGCTYEFNYLKARLGDDIVKDNTIAFLEGGLARSEYENVTVVDSIPNDIPENAWDVSARGNESIMAWYKDDDNNGKYELYIGQDGGVVANPDSGFLFAYFTNAKTIDLSKLNTSLVTNIGAMFAGTTSVEELDLSSWDTSSLTSISTTFASSGVKTVDLSGWDTSNVTTMAGMFQNCSNLTEIKGLSSFNTSNVTTMQNMFKGASNMTELDLSAWDTQNVTNMSYMFSVMNKLEKLDLSGFNLTNTDIYCMFLSVGSETTNGAYLKLNNVLLNRDVAINVAGEFSDAKIKRIDILEASRDFITTDSFSRGGQTNVEVCSEIGCEIYKPTVSS